MSYEVILWTAEWCGPCAYLKEARVLEKAIALFEKTYAGVPVKLRTVDVDENEEEATKAGIKAMPTIDFFIDGKKVDRTDANSAKELAARWTKAVSKAKAKK